MLSRANGALCSCCLQKLLEAPRSPPSPPPHTFESSPQVARAAAQRDALELRGEAGRGVMWALGVASWAHDTAFVPWWRSSERRGVPPTPPHRASGRVGRGAGGEHRALFTRGGMRAALPERSVASPIASSPFYLEDVLCGTCASPTLPRGAAADASEALLAAVQSYLANLGCAGGCGAKVQHSSAAGCGLTREVAGRHHPFPRCAPTPHPPG